VETFTQPQDIESDLPSTRDSDVPLGKSPKPQASLGKGPIAGEANVPVLGTAVPWYGEKFQHDLLTLSKTDLRRVYRREASCHKHLLERCAEYGSRGPRFFFDFLSLVGPIPARKATIDRRFNDWRDYAPKNIRWSDKETQTGNRECTLLFQPSDGGQPLTSRQLARRQKVTDDAIRNRRDRLGWTDAEIIAGKRSPTSTNAVPPKSASIESAPLEQVWMRCIALSYPGTSFGLTPAVKGMLRHFADACRPAPAEDVLDHVIQFWEFFPASVVRDHGVYLPNVPERPTIPFILKYTECAVNSWLETNRLFIGDDLLVHAKPEFTQEQIDFWKSYSPHYSPLSQRQNWLKMEAMTDLSSSAKLYAPGTSCLYLADLSVDDEDEDETPAVPDHERDNL
jgi:hypothetical protein